MAATPVRRVRPPTRPVVRARPERAGVGWATAAPEHDHGRAEPEVDRPPLRLVEGDETPGSPQRRRSARRRRTLVLALAALLIGLMLALAATHAMLVTGQERLDDLEVRVAQAQADYSRSRRDVAALAAPDRIVEEAIKLGMVEPDHVTYLSPSDALAKEAYGDSGLADGGSSGEGDVAAATSWSQAKRYLGTAP